ncbi:hypothetical protein WOSG25_110830 [Weissella oryzae SG25]|uniref:Uncharacterized protein n=1 Tax=Weissella oryzae (strain DSM 25784 / JCM 18191 / LMG 30913 / SG25) TaxID=1329250 RepID=A0A069CUW1_WEIOS|nr:hypothetical protein [Weissella oryzae]GAK31605.1 hypothetical protein WOSG25_110830 [Weissella oryzae SG25]
MTNDYESRYIYFVTDIKREKIILAESTEPLLHQALLDCIESKKIRNAGGYRLFKTSENELKSILQRMNDTKQPFYMVTKLKKKEG